MNFTDEQLEILYRAAVLARKNLGQVLEPWAFAEAHELAEGGWLERRFEADGEMSWWWTSQAEQALDVNRLVKSHDGRLN
jgi:hypothetical protein